MSLTSSCSGNDKIADTGTSAEEEFPAEEVIEGFDDAPSDSCHGEAGLRNLSGLQIDAYSTHGFTSSTDSSRLPTDIANALSIPDGLVTTARSESTCNGDTLPTGVDGVTGDWEATEDPDLLLDCGGKYSTAEEPEAGCGAGDATSCSGMYEAWVFRDIAAGATCDDYDPVHIALQTTEIGARRRVSDNAVCSAGSGTFQLLATRGRDWDHDDAYRVSLLPVQIDGTGVMTNAAWVTQIDVVEDQGYTLKVVQPDQPILWDLTDHLGVSTGSFTLSATNGFDEEEVSGNPVFVAEEIDPEDAGGMVVDMEWTCDVAPTVTQALGYVIPLDEIGCGYPQKLVMRLYGDPLWVAFEIYGNPNLAWAMPTTPASGGARAFTTGVGGLVVSGLILSHDNTDAEVELTSMTWYNVPVCDEDTYTFDAE